MERVKTMRRNAAASVAEAEPYRPEMLAEDEPRYLRRQKPVEIRRKKFGGRGWPFYRKVLVWSVVAIVAIFAAVTARNFLLYSPSMLLAKQDQVELAGNHIVAREAVLQQFLRDRGHSVLSVPLDARRSQIEQLPWVESASVQRILPHHIRVEVTERTPIAFVRNGNELALIDSHGVILDRPAGEDFQFPIVTRLSESMPREEREKRMQIFADFLKSIELVRPASTDRLSEVDLGSPKNLSAVMTGLAGAGDPQAVTIQFGQGDFTGKYRMLVENFTQWQARSGRVVSIDLQYSRQVVVNPDTGAAKAASR